MILISHNMPNVFGFRPIHIARLGGCAGVITPKSHTPTEAVAIMTGATTLERLVWLASLTCGAKLAHPLTDDLGHGSHCGSDGRTGLDLGGTFAEVRSAPRSKPGVNPCPD